MFSQITIGKKLMWTFGAMVALTLGLAYSALSSVGTLGNELDVAINKTAKKAELGGVVRTDAYAMRTALRGVVMFSLLKDPAKVEQNKEAFRNGSDHLAKTIEEIRPLLTTAVGRQALDSIQAGHIAWCHYSRKLHNTVPASVLTRISPVRLINRLR